jgi:nonribosomal peptide synthetase protein BlmIII
VAVTGAVLAGVPFHAINPASPQAARWRRLDDLQTDVVVTQSWLDERLRWPEGTVRIVLDTQALDASAPDGVTPPAGPDSVACVVAGTADGALAPVTHDAIVTTATDLANRFELTDTDRVLVVTALGDPASLLAIFGMLVTGWAVVIPDDIDLHTPSVWFDLMRRERVTVWQATPTLTGLLAEHIQGRGDGAPAGLRLALIGGEPLAPALVRRLRTAIAGDLRVAHLGPGGAAGLWATCFEVGEPDPSDVRVPVGRPLANKTAYLLSDALTPCPVWVEGRLFVGGRSLASATFGAVGPTDVPALGERLYRTELTGRLLPDGTIDVVGEDLARIAIRGHPVNLREVEGLLTAQPAVLAAAVVPVGSSSIAYAKLAPEATETGADLLDHLRRRMSPYLLPERVELVRAFGLTVDGRIDRVSLALQAEAAQARAAADAAVAAGVVSDDLLEAVCRLAARELGVSDVEPTMNLLDVGATSMQLVRVAAQAELEFDLVVDVEELLRFPSVAVLVSSAKRAEPVEPAGRPGAADGVEPSTPDLILDPVERLAFKDRQPGIRRDVEGEASVSLDPAPGLGELRTRLRRRRTHRTFTATPVSATALSTLLSVLGDVEQSRRAYPSAGSLYPVQVYLTVVDGQVDGVAGGSYYHHPLHQQLVALTPGARIEAEAHAWINRPAARSAAFALYLVADLEAIRPMYGDRARDYCLIEAGAMAQLLMSVAAELGLGLCPIGEMNAAAVRVPLRLGERHELVLVLAGGVPPDGNDPTESAQSEMLRRIGMLSSGDVPGQRRGA